ncbi:MAG: ATP-dependent DNA helicase RecG [Streptococcaceae bacterium]|jgi:ATP-dependent DNA helicase RecG|nr:ATP-dependent DNA helicase RecG [Streptococcaceae bacterium]
MKLEDSIQGNVKGIGEKKSLAFQTLGVETVKDLLFHFPFRYEDTSIKPLQELADGEKVTLKGSLITEASVNYYGRGNRLNFRMLVEGNPIPVNFFNQPYLKNKIKLGGEVLIYGKWDRARSSLTGMKILDEGGEDGFSPIYHTNQSIKQYEWVKFIRQVLDTDVLKDVEETLPEELIQKYRLMARRDAVLNMHFPKDALVYEQALRRMKFEELFLFQMKIQSIRHQEKEFGKGVEMHYDTFVVQAFLENLPFQLTDAQVRVLDEILSDMDSPNHMLRLLQGDVGSGKTIIAMTAMLAAKTAGFQSALMAPTEILALQHFEEVSASLDRIGVNSSILTGNTKEKERKETLIRLKEGELDVLIGTHALIQDDVEYKNLGLVITDEQHRFGVNQRRRLREKGENPDILAMTATPIPRTLAITVFGEMDVSIIDEMPAGRQSVLTKWVKHKQMPTVLEWLQTEIEKGNQAYVISPLIEESEALDLKNATDLFNDLQSFFGVRARVDLLHGKMKGEEKKEVMRSFKEHETDILCSTTVIEVGVNVPNATVMMIVDADRFGLAQLHQLRGRVGRGNKKSYCILIANPKSENGKKRMSIMTETNNGFVLSEKDLELRGTGDVFGTKQSGLPVFHVADIVKDFRMLEVARNEAARIWKMEKWWMRPEFTQLDKELAASVMGNEFD